jgi:Domain of Unknown Function (DUF928)
MTAPLRLFASTSLLFALVLPSALVFSTPSQARSAPSRVSMRYTPPKPPNRRAPGGSNRGAGSRECLRPQTQTKNPVLDNLGALVPSVNTVSTKGKATTTDVWGRTASSQPTLWFYSPYSKDSMKKVEFVLQDAQEQEVFSTPIAIPSRPGLVHVTLPAKAGLKPGGIYRWYFNVSADENCSRSKQPSAGSIVAPTLNDPALNGAIVSASVNGWLEYTPAIAALSTQLQKSTPHKRAMLYAENGFWYDALNTMAELKQAQPSDPAIAADWKELLKQGNLEPLASQPMVECCTLK